MPSEKLDTFSPSLNIRVFDKTMSDKSLIGVHEIKSLDQCNSEEGKHEGKGNGCYTVFCFSMQPKSAMKNLAVFIFHATICVTFFKPWLESR